MGSVISAIYDDHDQYQFFCEKYNEECIGIYGDWYDHFYELRDRNNEERRNLHKG